MVLEINGLVLDGFLWVVSEFLVLSVVLLLEDANTEAESRIVDKCNNFTFIKEVILLSPIFIPETIPSL